MTGWEGVAIYLAGVATPIVIAGAAFWFSGDPRSKENDVTLIVNDADGVAVGFHKANLPMLSDEEYRAAVHATRKQSDHGAKGDIEKLHALGVQKASETTRPRHVRHEPNGPTGAA